MAIWGDPAAQRSTIFPGVYCTLVLISNLYIYVIGRSMDGSNVDHHHSQRTEERRLRTGFSDDPNRIVVDVP
jgi:hypothetical protein